MGIECYNETRVKPLRVSYSACENVSISLAAGGMTLFLKEDIEIFTDFVSLRHALSNSAG